MACVVKKETLELLLARGGIITPDSNTQSVREDTQNRDIQGKLVKIYWIYFGLLGTICITHPSRHAVFYSQNHFHLSFL